METMGRSISKDGGKMVGNQKEENVEISERLSQHFQQHSLPFYTSLLGTY